MYSFGPSAEKYFEISPGQKKPIKKTKADEKIEIPILKLTQFTHSPKICFENIKLNVTKTLILRILNPKDTSQDVFCEKVPNAESGFVIEPHFLSLHPAETKEVLISWTPEKEGNTRDLIMWKTSLGVRAQTIILGTCINPRPKKKKNTRQPFQDHNNTRIIKPTKNNLTVKSTINEHPFKSPKKLVAKRSSKLDKENKMCSEPLNSTTVSNDKSIKIHPPEVSAIEVDFHSLNDMPHKKHVVWSDEGNEVSLLDKSIRTDSWVQDTVLNQQQQYDAEVRRQTYHVGDDEVDDAQSKQKHPHYKTCLTTYGESVSSPCRRQTFKVCDGDKIENSFDLQEDSECAVSSPSKKLKLQSRQDKEPLVVSNFDSKVDIEVPSTPNLVIKNARSTIHLENMCKDLLSVFSDKETDPNFNEELNSSLKNVEERHSPESIKVDSVSPSTVFYTAPCTPELEELPEDKTLLVEDTKVNSIPFNESIQSVLENSLETSFHAVTSPRIHINASLKEL